MNPIDTSMHLLLTTAHRLFALLLFISFSNYVCAVEISNIYQVDLQVVDQSKKARWKAVLAGFKQILVRRSGSSRILNSNETTRAYNKVTSYLQKSQYSRNADIVDEYKYVISLYFEARLIDDLIKRANQPLWDINRPVSMLWLSQEEIGQDSALFRRIIVENDNEMSINQLIAENSTRRGVPIILPLMDLEDDLLVSQSDVWGRFPEAIIEASQRYSIDSIIIGKIYQRGNLWLGQFTYLNQSKNVSFTHESENVDGIYEQMFDSLAEILCNKYCVTQTVTEGQELLIEIENVSNFETFQQITNYLSELSAVRKVDVINIYQDRLLLKSSLLSSMQAVVDSISLNRRLKVVVKEIKTNIDENDSSENALLESETKPAAINLNGIGIDENTAIASGISSEIRSELGSEINTVDSADEAHLETNTIYYRWID